MSSLSDLTIVIPSYERQAYLERQVSAWRDTPVRVLLLDGSAAPWALATAGELPGNIEYWHRPGSIETRLGFAADKVGTDYAVLLSDDELFLSSALLSCIEEISGTPGCVACKGLPLAFGWSGGVVSGREVYPTLRGLRIDQDTAEGRVRAHMSPYNMATLWAVMTRDVFVRTLRAVSAAGPFRSAAAVEMQVSLVTAWRGKCHVLSELMWLRSEENPNVWWNSGKQPFHDWYADRTNAAEVDAFLGAVVAAVESQTESRQAISRAMRGALDAYLEYYERVARERRAMRGHGSRLLSAAVELVPSRVRSRIRAGLAANLPDDAKQAIRAVLGRSPRTRAPLTLTAAAHQLADKGVRVDFRELVRLERLIAAFHLSHSARMAGTT